MDISPYTKYVRSMVEHGERRITEINWLFESVEKSLARAETNFIAEKKSRAYISLRHAKNLTGFLQKSLGDIPDQKLTKHLDEFFSYVDTCIETSLRLMPLPQCSQSLIRNEAAWRVASLGELALV